MHELPTPPEAVKDPDATELLRAWVIDQALHCTLNAGAFEDPATWGVLLADLMQQLADGLKEQEGRDPAQTLQAIRTAMEAELNAPNDPAALGE
jgi:hypothetical protein